MNDPVDYVRNLEIDTPLVQIAKLVGRGGGVARVAEGVVNLGAVLTFVGRLDEQQRDDVLQSVQLAQRAADAKHDRFTETERWYAIFAEVMQRIGWVTQQNATFNHSQRDGQLSINNGALKLLADIATQNALGVLSSALDTLKGMTDEHGTIQLLKFNSIAGGSGSIQIGVADCDDNGGVNLAMGAFQFKTTDRGGSILFALFSGQNVEFWGTVQKMTLDSATYTLAREAVRKTLGNANNFISSLGEMPSRIV